MPKRIVAALLILSVFTTVVPAQGSDGRPNILYILTDDQRYDSIRAFNQITHQRDESALGYVESPNVDWLVSQGTTFINTYVHATGCAPSRASIHLGRYPHRSGIYEFEYFNQTASHFETTLPEEMSRLGYQTFHVGKLGVRIRTTIDGKVRPYGMYEQDINFKQMWRDGFTDWSKGDIEEAAGQKLPEKIHADWLYTPGSGDRFEVTGSGLNDIPGLEDHSRAVDEKYNLIRMNTPKNPHAYGLGPIIGGVSPKPAGQTRDGHYVTQLGKFLGHPGDELKVGSQTYTGVDPQRPVFAHIGFDFPHTPVLPPKSFRNRFADRVYTIPQVDPDEQGKLPPQLTKLKNTKASNHFSDADQQQMVRDYYAFCAYGDQLVGEAADRFIGFSEAQGRPWMVVYICGDHGWKLNEHGLISKFTPWNIDSQNPIVVVSSDKRRFPAGKVVTDFTEFVDVMPTVLAAGGADLADPRLGFLDGYDLQAVAAGEIPARDYVLGESHAVTGPRATLRTKNFMFTMKTRPDKKRGQNQAWVQQAEIKDLEPVLYDLQRDPDELNNVAFDTAYTRVRDTMQKKLTDIVLGDGRVEVDWRTSTPQVYHFPVFAPGADDKVLTISQ